MIGNSAYIDQFGHSTTCGPQGHFEFDNVPAGKWFVVTAVMWAAPDDGELEQQGGPMEKEVDLAPGKTRVTLAGENQVDWMFAN